MFSGIEGRHRERGGEFVGPRGEVLYAEHCYSERSVRHFEEAYAPEKSHTQAGDLSPPTFCFAKRSSGGSR